MCGFSAGPLPHSSKPLKKILIPDPGPKDEEALVLGTETRKFWVVTSSSLNVEIVGIMNITVEK